MKVRLGFILDTLFFPFRSKPDEKKIKRRSASARWKPLFVCVLRLLFFMPFVLEFWLSYTFCLVKSAAFSAWHKHCTLARPKPSNKVYNLCYYKCCLKAKSWLTKWSRSKYGNWWKAALSSREDTKPETRKWKQIFSMKLSWAFNFTKLLLSITCQVLYNCLADRCLFRYCFYDWLISIISFYMISFLLGLDETQFTLAFSLGLASDRLVDRHTIDVIIAICFFPLCFKMAESFQNLDHILRDWAKDIVQKVLPRHWRRSRSRKKKSKAVSFIKWFRKKYSQSQSAVERD